LTNSLGDTSVTTVATAQQPRVLDDFVPGAGLVHDAALVARGATFVGAAAQPSIQTSLSPVPFTGQTFAVLLAAGVLGSVRGGLSMLVYLVAGACGAPWFAGGASGVLPSFGYIVGFIAAAIVVGWLAERGATASPLGTTAVMVTGNVIIYAVVATRLKWAIPLDWAAAMSKGLLSFLGGDALKIAPAAGPFPLGVAAGQAPPQWCDRGGGVGGFVQTDGGR
jgi:biotin transport system substrate-specific component